MLGTSEVSKTMMDWRLWRRQLSALIRIEIHRNLFCIRGFWVFSLALVPTLIAVAHVALGSSRQSPCSLAQDTDLFAWLFQLFQIRLACFFGSLGAFVRMFREEMRNKTIHYSLFAPIRREILVIGKYVAGSVGTALIFVVGSASCFITVYLHHGNEGVRFLLEGPGLSHLSSYFLVTILACLGYGAVFLAMSLVFRNPVLPAVVLLGWESVSGVLPAALQFLSVTYYLKPLFPTKLPVKGISGLFSVVVLPVPTWFAVVGLLLFSSVVVTLSAIYFRRIEVDTAES
jgi:ABC-type transport system involved in multi-copper enzyme maturation permease subunit